MFPLIATIGILSSTHTFHAGAAGWVMDGHPYQIRSGEIHYARIPHQYWKDRLLRAKAMGLNTVCTYVFWNFHNPEPGVYDFKGDHDIAAFVRTAQSVGLNVILRPGPYVCAEWEWGGYPYWLANIPGMAERQNNPQFLAETGKWLDRLGKELAPLTVKHGGPIILCQSENEYGSFGSDHAYTEAIRRQLLHAGFDCQMYTADGASDSMLGGGTLPDLPAAINFGGGAAGEFAELAKFRPIGPRMNGEFWCGWFDHWRDNHAVTSIEGQSKDLEWMDSRGYSFNFYMAHGGTSFGWMNGSNSGGHGFEPDTTSYDYDAPIGEDGRLTKKFFAFRDLIKKYLPAGSQLPEPPAALPKTTFPPIAHWEVANVLDQLPTPVLSQRPPTFEALHQAYGYILYEAQTSVPTMKSLTLNGLQDRATVFLDRQKLGTLERQLGQKSLVVAETSVQQANPLRILIENQGRINYSRALLKEHKGFSSADVDGVPLLGWKVYQLPFDHPETYRFSPLSSGVAGDWPKEPTLFRSTFSVNKPGDTYLDMRGWGKGNVWVNGHNLGRYWSVGPQQSLYLPAPYLKVGTNSIIVLDTEPTTPHPILSTPDPIFETHLLSASTD